MSNFKSYVDIKKKAVIEVDGEQVFTARWVLEQMTAQNASIDRANRIAVVAVLVSALLFILSVIL